jgi:zinc protease
MKRLLFLCCVLLLSALGRSQGVWAHERGDLAPDPAVAWGRLPNGLRYAVMPHSDPPDRISLRLYVNAGSLMEQENQRGLAHFLEHMAFNGTTHFPAEEMVQYFQRLGMAFGADTNAHTGFKETVYKLELPKNDPELLEKSLLLLRDYADGMLLSPREIDKERGVIMSEKRARDSVEFRTYQARMTFLLPESRLSQRTPIGLENVIQGAPRERFAEFYSRWYRPERLVVVAVGAVETASFRTALEKHFGSLAATVSPLGDPDLGPIPARGLSSALHYEPEAADTKIAIQTLRPYVGGADGRQKRLRDLRSMVATGIITRRLELLAKAPNAPFTHGAAYSYDWLQYLSNAVIQVSCKPEQWKAALGVAEQELRRALAYGFTAAEMDENKAKILHYYEQSAKSAATRKSRTLADALVRSVSDEEIFTSPQDELEFFRAVLQSLTAAQAHAALKELWQGSDISIFVSGNLQLSEAERLLNATYRASAAVPVKAPVEQAQAPFAYNDVGPEGKVVSQKLVKDLDVVQLTLGNQVLVNLKPTQFEANTIRLALRFGGGQLSAPADKPGLARLAESTFVEGGLQAHSADDLARLFAGKSVNVDFRVDDDAFVLSGQTTPQDLPTALRLLCAYLTAPGYRPEALRQARQDFEKRYLKLRHTPEGIMNNEVERFLASGDFRFGFPPESELLVRTLNEVRDWLAVPLRSGWLEVSVVGDFKTETMVEELRRTVGALPVRQREKSRSVAARAVRFPQGPQQKVFHYESEISKAMLAIFWPTADIWDIGRTRRLGVLASVLSDRLRIKIREELGDAYSPYATINASDTYTEYGYLTAVVLTAPEHAAKIAPIIHGICRDLRQQGISEDELQRALKPTLASLQEWVRNNRYWLNTVLLKSREYPQRLDWCRTMREDFSSITVGQINALAAQYLRADSAVDVSVLPSASFVE